jgi:hypothetical protein
VAASSLKCFRLYVFASVADFFKNMGKFKKNKSGLQASPEAELDSKDVIASASPKMEVKSKKLMKKKKDKSKAKFEQKMKKKKFKDKEDGGETDDDFTLGKM